MSPAASAKQFVAELSQDLTPIAAALPDDGALWAALTPGSRRVGVVKGPARGGAMWVAFSPSLSGRVGLLDALPRGQRAAVAAAAEAVNEAAAAAAAADGTDTEAVDAAAALAAFGPAATPGRRVVVEVLAAAAASQRLRLSMAATVSPGDGVDVDGDGWVVAQVKAALLGVGLRVALPAKVDAVVPLTGLVASGGLDAGV
eukprot:contig_43207_g9713